MQAEADLTGQFLIAMPGLSGEPFERSVCFICQYDQQGALGMIINRSNDLRLGEILEQTSIEPVSEEIANLGVYTGGPVNSGRCLIVHQPIGNWAATLQVNDQIGVTGSSDILEAIAAGEGPEQFLVCLGYAGWGPGQLDQEMLDNSWLTGPASAAVMFDTPARGRWRAAMAMLGIDPDRLSSDMGHS